MDLDIETNKYPLSPIANQSPTADPIDKTTVSESYDDNSFENGNLTTLNISTLQPTYEKTSQSGGIKRPAPPTSTSSSSPPPSPTTHNINPPKTQQSNQIDNKKTEENTAISIQKKKLKSSTEHFIDTIDEHLLPCKPIFNETRKIPINYDQFKLLIENCLNSKNPREECVPFNISSINMLKIIDLIRPKITSLSGKNRLTRIHRTFFNALSDKELSSYDTYDIKNPFN